MYDSMLVAILDDDDDHRYNYFLVNYLFLLQQILQIILQYLLSVQEKSGLLFLCLKYF